MALATLVIGGLLGLVLGVLLYTTRSGGILASRLVFTVLNVGVNIIRPIPFVIVIIAIGPLTILAVGTQLGTTAATFALIWPRSSASRGSSSRTSSPSTPE